MAKRLGPSEFEGNGLHESGVQGLETAHEKMQIIKRTEQDPDGKVDLDAKPDKWRHGGLESTRDKIL